MHDRYIYTFVATAMMSLVLVLLLAGGSAGQTDPPASGDWIIADTTLVSDQTVNLHGDLTVTSTGSLTLENVTLRFHVNSDGQYGLEVQTGGSLTIRDGDGQAATIGDASSIVAVPASRAIFAQVWSDTTLRISNSFITQCGYVPSIGTELLGLYIESDDAIISGTTIDSNLHGLVLRGATITVTDSYITNSTYHGVNAQDSDVTLQDCILADNGYEGARFMRGDAVVDGCQVLNNRNGIVIRTGCNATIANTTIKGNNDGIFIEINPVVEVLGCTIRGQGHDGISAEYWTDLTIRDSLIAGSTRNGLRAFNDVTITSSGNNYRNNVYGARLKMDCQMTSNGDIFTGNTNTGLYLESTSDLVIVEGLLYGNVAGLKADDASTVIAWATVMNDNTFEGYVITDSDIELHDGTIANCSGGGIVLAGFSNTSWTVHAGNSSVLMDCVVTLNGDVTVRGDLLLRDTVMTFLTGPLVSHSFLVDGGDQEWQNSSIQTSDFSQGIAFSVEGTATGKAWYFGIRSSGKVFSSQPSYARVAVPFEFHRSTFRDGDHGLEIMSDNVIVDRCSFIDNLVGVLVQGVTVRFENCTFTSSTNWHVRVEQGGDGILVNSTYDPAKVELDGSTDRWSAWWTVLIKVSFPTGHPVSGADVEVRDEGDNIVFIGTTGARGNNFDALVKEQVTTQAGQEDRTPHLFRATYGTSWAAGHLNVTSHLWVSLVLTDPYPPILEITSHVDGGHIDDPVLTLEGTASDSGSSLFKVEARISTQAWQTVTGLDNWSWTTTLPGDGTYPMSVRAWDYALNNVTIFFNLTLDTEVPDIDIEVPPTPANNSLVGSVSVSIVGFTDAPDVRVSADGVNGTMDGTLFTINLTLSDGLNVITIRAIDPAGNEASLDWHITIDLEAPPLEVIQPVDGTMLNVTSLTLMGTTDPFQDVYFRVPELSNVWSLLTVSGSGYFSQEITELKQGINTVQVMVSGIGGAEVNVSRMVYVDTVPPDLLITVPHNGASVRFDTLDLTGNYTEVISRLTIGSIEAFVEGANFSIEIELSLGVNNIRLIATDLVGNVGAVSVRLTLDTTPPGLDLPGYLWNEEEDVFDPMYIDMRTFVLVGTTELGADVHIDGWLFDADELGRFSAELTLEEGENILEVLIIDRAGNEFTTDLTIILDTYAPQLEIKSPKDRYRTSNDYVWVSGTVTPGDLITIGEHATVSENGSFRIKVSLDDALNLLVITASDEAGNQVSAERLVFLVEDTEGITGYAILDENCQSLLLVMVIVILSLGVILAFAWREEDTLDRREQALEEVFEEDHIELDKPHLEPTTGYLQYDPTSSTGRKPEFEESQDEEYISMADFAREMERRDQ